MIQAVGFPDTRKTEEPSCHLNAIRVIKFGKECLIVLTSALACLIVLTLACPNMLTIQHNFESFVLKEQSHYLFFQYIESIIVSWTMSVYEHNLESILIERTESLSVLLIHWIHHRFMNYECLRTQFGMHLYYKNRVTLSSFNTLNPSSFHKLWMFTNTIWNPFLLKE